MRVVEAEAEAPGPAARRVRVKVAAAALNPVDAGVRVAAVEVAAGGARPAEPVRLAGEGVLTLRVAETCAPADAAKAHVRLAEGGVRGWLVRVPQAPGRGVPGGWNRRGRGVVPGV